MTQKTWLRRWHLDLAFLFDTYLWGWTTQGCVLSLFSCVWLFVTLWTVTCQALLSLGFSRQEHWSGLPCPPPGDLTDPEIEPSSLMSPALAGGFFTTSATLEWSESYSVTSDSLWPQGLYSPWNSPGWNTGVGSHFLLNLAIKPRSPTFQVSLFASWATGEAQNLLKL